MREGLEDDEIDENAEVENYCEDDEPANVSVDEFNNSKERVEVFKSSLLNPQGLDNPDSFFYAIIYALRYNQNVKTDLCSDDDELRLDVTPEIFDEISSLQDKLKLDLDISNFENKCFRINGILMKSCPFLRMYEIKDKFRYLIKEDSERKKIMRDLLSCITERFNGFNIVKLELDREPRQEMFPIDILYRPVRKRVNIDCFFTTEINLAYRTSFSEGGGGESDTERLINAFIVQITMAEKMFGRRICSIVPVVRALLITLTLEVC